MGITGTPSSLITKRISKGTTALLAWARRRLPKLVARSGALAIGTGTATPLTEGVGSIKKAAEQPAPPFESTPSDETVRFGAANMGPAWNEKLTPSMLNTLYLKTTATVVRGVRNEWMETSASQCASRWRGCWKRRQLRPPGRRLRSWWP